MKISMSVIMDENRVIGKAGKIPWHLPNDLKRFKALTLHKPIVMGRKTYDSIARVLPERRNVVITRNKELCIAGVEIYHSLQETLAALSGSTEIIIIGGEEIYRMFLSRTDTIYLTLVHSTSAGDCYFPKLNDQQWQEIEHVAMPADAKHAYPYSFITLLRKRKQE